MNVSLTMELEKRVNERVESGLYGSASEVVREALRLLFDRDRLREQRLKELREEIRRGLVQLDSGHSAELEVEVIKRKARQRSLS